jgi:DNA polymerase-3 subunit beta
MKIEVNLGKLKEATDIVGKVAGKHISLPILSCILFDIENNTATLKATNLEIGVEVIIPVKTNSSGKIAIPASTLNSFLTQIQNTNQIVKLEITDGLLKIECAKTKSTIKTMPVDDFPTLPSVVEGKNFNLNSSLITKGFKSVYYSASVSAVKPELSSVYVYTESDNLVFVATDSFRLAEKKVRLNNPLNIEGILIPFKNTADLISILDKINNNVSIQSSKNLISFEGNGIKVVSRVIDGTFPDYKQIIPKSFLTEAVVLKEDFINSLKISNIFSDKFSQTRFIINPKGSNFEIQTKNNDIGENSTSIDATLSGEIIEATFNYKYIADSFQSIDADSLSLQFNGAGRPLVIRPISGDQSFLYLVMPMNR